MITAQQIADWASSAEAQRQLPRLIRRLIHSAATTTEITMPAGESTALPGLDGELHSPEGNAWVPKDRSCWEASCRGNVGTKANEDYAKRVAQIDARVRAERTYVSVTARRWPGKARWLRGKRGQADWAEVRAYDADDIEHWLEQSPAVALAFAEELGLTGAGVTSPQTALARWCDQCRPKIDGQALLTGREAQEASTIEQIRKVIAFGAALPIALRADSVEEATAFACACLLKHDDLAARSVIVTETTGWQYIDKNPQIAIAIASSPEIADTPAARDNLAVVIPYASGDMAQQFRGVAGRTTDRDTHLERPDFREFETALAQVGVDANDARRLASLCGRSWSVFRRQHAINPAIRRPAWLQFAASRVLSTVCLLNTWSSGSESDKEIVSHLAGRPYTDIEHDLLELSKLDDSPVIHIGRVWKAKSPLELLSLFSDRISNDELDRFFSEAEALLKAPDPQLDLPESERYAAALHGKVRPTSGFILDAICETLIKLAVRGPDVEALVVSQIASRVDRLVRSLLRGGNRLRWLSLSSQLPALAEARSPTHNCGSRCVMRRV